MSFCPAISVCLHSLSDGRFVNIVKPSSWASSFQVTLFFPGSIFSACIRLLTWCRVIRRPFCLAWCRQHTGQGRYHHPKDLAIPLDPYLPELSLPRGSLRRLLAARSGHGDFAQHQECFNHEDALLFCFCGQHKTPQHFYHCHKGRRAAQHPWTGLACNEVLGTKTGAQLFNEWFLKYNFYNFYISRAVGPNSAAPIAPS